MRSRTRALALLLLIPVLAVGLPSPGEADTAGTPVVDRIDGLRAADPSAALGADAGLSALSFSVLSDPVRAPMPFSLLAFTAPPGTTIEYRTSVDGTDWTPWAHAEPPEELGPDPGTTEALAAEPDYRHSGEPMWVGEAEWVQARVSGASPTDVEVDVVDSMGLSRSVLGRARDAVAAAWHGRGTATAHAKGAPTIVSRAQWGADESLRSGSPGSAEARYGVLHHTVGSNSYSRAEAPGVVRGIYAYHTRSRGWSDIGYNFLVDRFGTIYEGRAGGVENSPIGAHVAGFNTGSIGVAMMGDHEAAPVPAATTTAVADLFAWKFAVHGIDPGGSVDITSQCASNCRHARGEVVTLPTLFGHRDAGLTACPGRYGYAELPGLRSAIAKRDIQVLANDSVAPSEVSVSPAGLSKPVRLGVDVVPPGPWELVIKYNDGTLLHSASGSGSRARVTWEGSADLRAGTYWYKFTSPDRSPAIGKFTVTRLAYTPPFSDDDDSVHAEAIADLFARRITRGCTTTTYCPTRTVTREQMASFLDRTLDDLELPKTRPSRDHFVDDDGSVHEDAINTLTEGGVSAGCDVGAFCPRQAARRGDVAQWLANAFRLPPSDVDHFVDDDGHPAEPAINALAAAGLTEGCDADRYCLGEATRRGQMASFLSRAIGVLEQSPPSG